MEVRKVCNHPFLIKGAEDILTKDLKENQLDEFLIQSSSKLVLIDKLLKKLKEGNHKVLIFSQMVQMLNIIEDFLNIRGHTYCRLDGTIRGNERQTEIDKFFDEKQNIFIFLVSTRAGGVGINLTQADTVIIFDSE
jgi:chromodomain-helicase-DNA-binding protein 7